MREMFRFRLIVFVLCFFVFGVLPYSYASLDKSDVSDGDLGLLKDSGDTADNVEDNSSLSSEADASEADNSGADSSEVDSSEIEDEEIKNNIDILLYDVRAVMRRISALYLGQFYLSIYKDKIISILMEALHDEDTKVRKNVSRSLARLKAYRAIPELFKLIVEEDASVRNQAIRAIGTIGSKLALKPLLSALNDEDRDVRMSAVWGLSRVNEREAMMGIIDKFFDEDEYVRAYAASYVVYFNDKRAISFLKHLYSKDEALRVRQNAYLSLKRLGLNDLEFPREEVVD